MKYTHKREVDLMTGFAWKDLNKPRETPYYIKRWPTGAVWINTDTQGAKAPCGTGNDKKEAEK